MASPDGSQSDSQSDTDHEAVMGAASLMRREGPGRPATADDPRLLDRAVNWYLRHFLGSSVETIASNDGVSERTVQRSLEQGRLHVADVVRRLTSHADADEAGRDERNLQRRRRRPPGS